MQAMPELLELTSTPFLIEIVVKILHELAELSATRVLPAGVGDENTIKSAAGGQGADFLAWCRAFWSAAAAAGTAARAFVIAGPPAESPPPASSNRMASLLARAASEERRCN